MGYVTSIILASMLASSTATQMQDSLLTQRLVKHESTFRPSVKSKAGAVGLTQLLPSTAQEVALKMFGVRLTPKDLENPLINLVLGQAYLLDLVERTGSLELALHAYNMGPGNVNKGRRNHSYVSKILNKGRAKSCHK